MLQTLLLGSCNVLHDDLSGCDLYLKFKYDYNLSYEDWFGKQVEEIKVFIFDKEGKYVETITETTPAISAAGYKMTIPSHMKGYSVVVWAGKTDKDYTLSQMTLADPIDKLLLHYKLDGNISTRKMAPLWHSASHQMTFPDAGGTEQTISLVRNTNDFHITVLRDANENITSYFEVKIDGANGSYDYENNLLKGIPEINYRRSTETSETSTVANIYTMRLIENVPMRISARDMVSDEYILIEGEKEADLTKLLLKSKPEGMTGQEYLDRKYIWDISLQYNSGTYMAISITINDWTYWFHNTDI